MISLKNAKLIFWDFDGVIKDSVDVKTQAFVQLFQSFGKEIAARVREHHEDNGGMSRYDKIPIYLSWAGESTEKANVDAYCIRFAQIALQGVIDAPWVSGIETILRTNPDKQIFILVTATPRDEIEEILKVLDIRTCFQNVFGAPVNKKDAISITLAERKIEPQDSLMIGDALADYHAAQVNNVPFLLRRHDANTRIFRNYTGDAVKDFKGL